VKRMLTVVALCAAMIAMAGTAGATIDWAGNVFPNNGFATAPTGDQAVYRVRRVHRRGDVPKKYRHTLELTDDRTQQVMAACDLIGRATFTTLAITDEDQRDWQMRPNRKVMPSRWIVTDPDGRIAMQFDQKMLGKLVNPLYRVALALLDGEGEQVYRLVDQRTSTPDRIFGVPPREWALLAGDKPAAKLARLPKQKEKPTGALGKLRSLLAGSDQGIISAGPDHVLAAPVALGMLMVFDELTDTSG